jgi:hypothetical protein
MKNLQIQVIFISKTVAYWDVVSESHAIINDLDVILHGFMLQFIHTTVFRVKQLNNLKLRVRLFNRFTYKYNLNSIQIYSKFYQMYEFIFNEVGCFHNFGCLAPLLTVIYL